MADVFDHIEMLYHPKRRLSPAGDLSPAGFENPHCLKTGTAWKIRADSALHLTRK